MLEGWQGQKQEAWGWKEGRSAPCGLLEGRPWWQGESNQQRQRAHKESFSSYGKSASLTTQQRSLPRCLLFQSWMMELLTAARACIFLCSLFCWCRWFVWNQGSQCGTALWPSESALCWASQSGRSREWWRPLQRLREWRWQPREGWRPPPVTSTFWENLSCLKLPSLHRSESSNIITNFLCHFQFSYQDFHVEVRAFILCKLWLETVGGQSGWCAVSREAVLLS